MRPQKTGSYRQSLFKNHRSEVELCLLKASMIRKIRAFSPSDFNQRLFENTIQVAFVSQYLDSFSRYSPLTTVI